MTVAVCSFCAAESESCANGSIIAIIRTNRKVPVAAVTNIEDRASLSGSSTIYTGSRVQIMQWDVSLMPATTLNPCLVLLAPSAAYPLAHASQASSVPTLSEFIKFAIQQSEITEPMQTFNLSVLQTQ